MKILLGVPEYPPHTIGGGGEVYTRLVDNYQRMGHEVSVVYGYFPSSSFFEKVKSYKKNGIHFFRIPQIPTPSSLPYLKTRMPLTVDSFLKLSSIIESVKPDVAHLHGYGILYIEILANNLYKKNVPYVLTMHGLPVKHSMSKLWTIVYNIYKPLFLAHTIKHASAFTTVSTFLKQQLPQQYQSKTTVIPNGIDSQQYQKRDSKIYTLHPTPYTLSILSLGRISHNKGFQEIVKIIPEFIKQGIEVTYYIAGRDEGYKSELIQLIKKLKLQNQVLFLEHLNEKERIKYLRTCDIVAIPSLVEGFSLVALEAMACRKLILTTGQSAVEETTSTYNKKINIYSNDLLSQIQKKLSIEGNFDTKKFDWNYIAQQYSNVLKKCLT